MVDTATLHPRTASHLQAMHEGDAWMTASELGLDGRRLSVMAIQADPLVERRMAVWGGEDGQKHGRGYEYRLTPLGAECRKTLDAADTGTDAADADIAPDALDALRAMLAPPTRAVQVQSLPPVRRKICAKCPFGTGLTRGEQVQADALKTQLAAEPHRLWGCHETVDGKPQICAGFAATRPDVFPIEKA